MTIPAEQSGASNEGAPALSPAEQASVEVGQRGFSEPTNVNTPPPSGAERPDHIPEKFWKDGQVDIEAMAKSYSELERERSKPKEGEEAPKVTPEEPPVSPNGKIEKQKEQSQEPKADEPSPLATAMDLARTEWSEKNEVSEETVAQLEAAGIPKEIFSVYLKGLDLITKEAMGQVHSFADGEENYNAMAAWASQSLSDEELEAYNSALDNPQLRENAVRGLYSRYTAARPSEGKLITPSGTPAAAGDVYSSRDQLVADQKDPRYQTDESFRQGVMDKLVRSQRNGFQVVGRQMFEREVYTRG